MSPATLNTRAYFSMIQVSLSIPSSGSAVDCKTKEPCHLDVAGWASHSEPLRDVH